MKTTVVSFKDDGVCQMSGKSGRVAVLEIGSQQKTVLVKNLLLVLEWNASLPEPSTALNQSMSVGKSNGTSVTRARSRGQSEQHGVTDSQTRAES